MNCCRLNRSYKTVQTKSCSDKELCKRKTPARRVAGVRLVLWVLIRHALKAALKQAVLKRSRFKCLYVYQCNRNITKLQLFLRIAEWGDRDRIGDDLTPKLGILDLGAACERGEKLLKSLVALI